MSEHVKNGASLSLVITHARKRWVSQEAREGVRGSLCLWQSVHNPFLASSSGHFPSWAQERASERVCDETGIQNPTFPCVFMGRGSDGHLLHSQLSLCKLHTDRGSRALESIQPWP